ncbi:MAG: GNAT family N-acetyltransferase [candidate division Zixibacteria bacterium]|nr:GNAT family N-acetyltransferase [candidate division Zixibacteria bacterium]
MFDDFKMETERLVIETFTPDDLEDFHAIVSNKEVTRYIPEDPMTLEKFTEIFNFLLERYKKNTPENIVRFSLAVREKETRRLAGWVGLGQLEINHEEIEIYYGMGRESWGRGYATEAARELLRYGFENLKLERIVAIVLPDNPASIRVVEKIGLKFVRDITGLPEEKKFFEGVKYFALTRSEFSEITG